jgi:hypothetical protein
LQVSGQTVYKGLNHHYKPVTEQGIIHIPPTNKSLRLSPVDLRALMR